MWHYFILLQVLVAHWVGTLQWRPIEHDCVSNHQSGDCLLNRLFMCRSKKKLHVTGLCAGNSPVTGEFPTQKASNAENVSIWWRHHGEIWCYICIHSDLIQTISYYWSFVRGIHRSLVNSPHKDQWCGALMFSLIWAWTSGWVNNRDAGDLRRYRANYDVTVMKLLHLIWRSSTCKWDLSPTGNRSSNKWQYDLG